MTLKKINFLEYAFGEGGGGHQKAYAVYAFINVDNCERPLTQQAISDGLLTGAAQLLTFLEWRSRHNGYTKANIYKPGILELSQC